MKQIVLTNINYLNHTREDLIKIGFTSQQINEVVYGDLKEAVLNPIKLNGGLNNG